MKTARKTNLMKGLVLLSCVSVCQSPLSVWAQANSASTQTVPADVQAATLPADPDDAVSQVAPAQPAQEQPEVMTRGPVHEAYADPVNLEPETKSLAAPKAPPANIKELPPPDKPDGNQYVWVPGYWAWDDDRNDYIWISACWRVPRLPCIGFPVIGMRTAPRGNGCPVSGPRPPRVRLSICLPRPPRSWSSPSA